MINNQPLTLTFSNIEASDLLLVGGKAANLGEMTRAGFPVPAGFSITTIAFQKFMDSSRMSEEVYRDLEMIDSHDLDSVRNAGLNIRQKLQKISIPVEIIEDIKKSWRELGTENAYAVRSSATAEDLPDASFAGQQDTYLNVIGETELINAVKNCWLSLFTDRAILYRSQKNYNHRDVQLSVIVQQMVLSEKSGVLFTANPITGHRYTTAIDASYGLGEALVGGLVTPDTYLVDTRTSDIVECNIGNKEIAFYPLKTGGTQQVRLGKTEQRTSVLNETQIIKLAEMGKKIESHYGYPQDIEWAIVKDEVFLLQTRPITSLYPIEGLKPDDESLHIYLSLGHQQSMMDAITPFGLSTIQVLLPIGHERSRFENTSIRASGGRLFADITAPLSQAVLRKGLLALLSQLDALAPEAAKAFIQRPEFKQSRRVQIRLSFFKPVFGIVRRVFLAITTRDLTGFVHQTNMRMDEYIEETTDRLDSIPCGRQQIEVMLDIMPKLIPFFITWAPETVAGILSTRILSRIARKWLSTDEIESLTLGIQGNVVNEMNLAISDLADIARGNPQIMAMFNDLGDDGKCWIESVSNLDNSTEFLSAWDSFINQYGSRALSEIDISKPRWYEEPLPILRVIAEFIKGEEGRHRAHTLALVNERTRVYDILLADAGKGLFGYFWKRVIKRLYYVMTEVGGMREHHKFMVLRGLAVIKERLKSNAVDLMRKEKLRKPSDLWYLTWKELFDLSDNVDVNYDELIDQRKAMQDRYQTLTPPMIISSDGEGPVVQYKIDDAPDGAILGNPVSPGVVEGVIRIVHDPQKEALSPGEILVAEFTDPGWTPLFINAGGLILEVGGALTHGAVVAREYGMPAIVGVRKATEVFITGQRVRIDGNRGIIEVLDSAKDVV